MVAGTTYSRTAMTGRARVRPGWFGRQVLQVELRRDYFQLPHHEKVLSTRFEWSDATWEHMQARPSFTIGHP